MVNTCPIKMSSPAKKEYKLAPTEDLNGGLEMGRLNHNYKSPITPDDQPPGKRLPKTFFRTRSRRPCVRTKLEKYLVAVCVLLIVACIAFIIIAFTRDANSWRLYWSCKNSSNSGASSNNGKTSQQTKGPGKNM